MATATAPVIDGSADTNGIWDAATSYALGNTILGPVVVGSNRGAAFKALWDSAALHESAQVDTEEIRLFAVDFGCAGGSRSVQMDA